MVFFRRLRRLAAGLALLAAGLTVPSAGDTLAITQGSESTLSYGDAPIEWLPFLSYVNRSAIVTFSEHADALLFPTTDGMKVSFDGGVTWPTFVQNQNFYCSSVIRRADGSLMATSYITQKADSLDITGYHWISVDNGQTWTPRTSNIVSPNPQPTRNANWGGLLFHRTLIQMADGSIQGTMYGEYTGDKRNRVVWIKSTDGGANWTVVSTVAYSPTIGSEGYNEPVGIQAADGSLLVIMRTGSASYPLYQTRSTDGGLTWSDPITLPGVDPAATYSVDPDLTMMANGTLVLSFGRPSTNLLFSLDGSGYSWGFLTTPIFAASTKDYMGVREVAPNKLLIVADLGNSLIEKYVTVTRLATEAPTIPASPQSQTVTAGANVTLSVTAGGSLLSYQWQINGAPIVGATSPTLTLANIGPAQAGSYAVVVTNNVGSVTSSSAVVTVDSAPAITAQPVSQTVAPGSTVILSVAATGYPAPTYQWKLGSTVLSNAPTGRLVISSVTAANAGAYTCTATNAFGSATSAAAALTVTATTNPGRLINLSVLSIVQTSLTMGFVIGGAGTNGSQNLLIRAIGPTLGTTPFNVPGAMADPTLAVIRQSDGATLAANAGWGTPSSNLGAVSAVESAVGAFQLSSFDSLDSAVVTALPGISGGYSARAASKTGGVGYALTEVYDATAAGAYTAASPRLVNLSCLTQISAGGTLTVGFVVGGATAKTVLVRVSGPTLAAAPFGIGGTMPDPQLTVQPLSSASTILAANAGWGGDAQLASIAAGVGAFAFASPSSKDSAAALTLPAGVPHTVQVSSASGAGGWVLVEIYEVP